MFEMAIVLSACMILIVVSYEYARMIKVETAKNSRDFF